MSIAWWLFNKQARDEPLRPCKLPFDYITVEEDDEDWNSIAFAALNMAEGILPADANGFIAKSNYGGGASGTFHVVRVRDANHPEGELWEDTAGADPPEGTTQLHIERFEPAFGQHEYRLWFKFRDNGRTTPKFMHDTRVEIDGERGLVHTNPTQNLNTIIPLVQRDNLKRRVVEQMTTHDLKLGAKNLSNMRLNHLWFRLDFTVMEAGEEGDEYLGPTLPLNNYVVNEIDMFPLGYTFIDEYLPHAYDIHDLAGSVVDYIILHWQSGWQC